MKTDEKLPQIPWTPLLSNLDNIQKDRTYSIRIDDFTVDLTPYTVFNEGGLTVAVSGTRLYYLMKNRILQEDSLQIQCESKKNFRKSMKNVCFKNCRSKKDVVLRIKNSVNLPSCMLKLLDEILIRPRGNRFRKRFVLNCYLVNVIRCKKCGYFCLEDAVALLYKHDSKCCREFNKLCLREENVYKPPKCENMKTKERLCPISGKCKGANPMSNF